MGLLILLEKIISSLKKTVFFLCFNGCFPLKSRGNDTGTDDRSKTTLRFPQSSIGPHKAHGAFETRHTDKRKHDPQTALTMGPREAAGRRKARPGRSCSAPRLATEGRGFYTAGLTLRIPRGWGAKAARGLAGSVRAMALPSQGRLHAGAEKAPGSQQ